LVPGTGPRGVGLVIAFLLDFLSGLPGVKPGLRRVPGTAAFLSPGNYMNSESSTTRASSEP
jgi:hypothetical protein